MLLVLNLQFSELLENGIGDLAVRLHFSDLVIWPILDIQRSEKWIWQYPELHPDQLRVVTRLNQTEEIYSPQVAVRD